MKKPIGQPRKMSPRNQRMDQRIPGHRSAPPLPSPLAIVDDEFVYDCVVLVNAMSIPNRPTTRFDFSFVLYADFSAYYSEKTNKNQ